MWRNSYLRPRMLGLDGRIFGMLLLTALHLRLWTLEITLVIALLLGFVEIWKKVTIEDALRGVRAALAGSRRPGRLEDLKRRSVDYGYVEWLDQQGWL